MKHFERKHIEQLIGSAADLELVLDDTVAEALVSHLDLVVEKNRSLNLTRITSPEEAIRLHLLDSLAVLHSLVDAPPGPVMDLGTGAGFPGIPIALTTNRPVVLVESVKKKAAAVSEFCSALGLDERVRVLPLRAEEVAALEPRSASVVVARALTALPSLLELAAPLLVPGGVLVALKARPEPEEITAGDRVARIVGFDPASIERMELPGGDEQRTILTYRMARTSSVALPRRTGLAQKEPLG